MAPRPPSRTLTLSSSPLAFPVCEAPTPDIRRWFPRVRSTPEPLPSFTILTSLPAQASLV
jgi:hypothetical protein